VLGIVNDTSTIPNIATSVDALNVQPFNDGTNVGLHLYSSGTTADKVSLFRVNFSSIASKFNSFTVSHDSTTGGSVLNVTAFFIRASDNTLQSTLFSVTDGGNTFSNYSNKVNGLITGISFAPQPGQNQWRINSISLNTAFTFSGTVEEIDQEMSNLSSLILTYSPLDPTCEVEEGTTRASSTDLDDLQFFYNQMTTDQKNTFKQNYPNAWGRLQFLFSKANRTIS
jgi:hypothetical protein